LDLNQRPPGYEPDELPDCSTPRYRRYYNRITLFVKTQNFLCKILLTGQKTINIMKNPKMAAFLFFLLAGTCVGSVLAMVISKNQAHNALFLVLAFACLGGLFGLLDAPFIAAVQIIIYAGAIMVLFIFVVMMVNLRQGIAPEKKKWTLVFSGGLAVVLAVELVLAVRGTFSALGRTGGEKTGAPAELGRLLFTDYLYPFEITSILIIAALVGAIVLVKKGAKE
jgi:NADH-quinone oxidoreductase subunit J